MRVRPFLKWAGGKTQLLGHILPSLPAAFGRYYEPFVGGGAVFFALGPKKATLSDINPDLILAYRAVRDDVEAVIHRLGRFVATPEQYYAVRAQDPRRLSEAAQAARTIYLNRTCFNGLYRVNTAGRFNVPFGRYTNPRICQAEVLRRASAALRGVRLRHQPVEALLRQCRRGDLVYLDPPYDPVSKTASFVGYARGGFGRQGQERLAALAARLALRGVHVVLSNADTPLIRQLYRDFSIQRIAARRNINSVASKRGSIYEVLICAGPARLGPAPACPSPRAAPRAAGTPAG